MRPVARLSLSPLAVLGALAVLAELAVLGALAELAAAAAPRPHIVFILADDLGWNDVGFHGMNQVPTPNLDALAGAGRPLQRYYTLPVCTPSRAALMTGKHPIRTGMQRGVIYGMEPRGLPLAETILPQHLKRLGYRTHLVGKWHLGSYRKEYLPLNRGFDSHLGFWTGKIDMYDHTNMERGSWGFDFRRGFQTAHDLFGKYVTDIYTEEAVKIIKNHNASEPLLLVMAHSAVHSGNPNQPIRAPDALVDSFRHIADSHRQKFAAVLHKLDSSVGAVTSALGAAGLLADTILVFSTDNGGVPQGFNDNAGSNYPLRGTKNTLWEGGVRGAGFVWSARIKRRAALYDQLVHISDWLPTLYRAAGGNVSSLGELDGVDQWEALVEGGASTEGSGASTEGGRASTEGGGASTEGGGASTEGSGASTEGGGASTEGGGASTEGGGAAPRSHVLHNIDDQEPTAAITVGRWKLLQGTTYKGEWDGWYGPAGRDGNYSVERVYSSPAAQAIARLRLMPAEDHFLRVREAATVKCESSVPARAVACAPLAAPCLFDVLADPCEARNLAQLEPGKVSELQALLAEWRDRAVPPNNAALDPRGDPARWGRTYTNFRDYRLTNNTDILYL